MPNVRRAWTPPALLCAAACVAAGDLVGLWLAGPAGPAGPAPSLGTAASATGTATAPLALLLLLVGGGALALPAAGRTSGRRANAAGPPALLACLACAAAGVALGLEAGAASVASCAARLRDGDAVVASGRLTTAVRPRGEPGLPADGPAARWARSRLADAELVGPEGRCRLPALAIRVEREAAGHPAGVEVVVRGMWEAWSEPGARLPRPASAYGRLRGRTLAASADGPPPPSRERLRAWASGRLDRLPPDVRAAGRSLLLAEREDLDPAVRRRFVDAGLAHLLAISGLHVGVLAGGLLWLTGGFSARRRRPWAAVTLTWGYVALIGAPASAVRATIMFTGWAAARARGAPARPGDLAGLAALVALAASPDVLLEPGFQLSFAGVGGVVLGDAAARRLSAAEPSGSSSGARREGVRPGMGRASDGALGARWIRLREGVAVLRARAAEALPHATRRHLRAVGRAAGAGTGAFLLTAPVAAAHFRHVAPAAAVAGLIGTPLVALALPALLAVVCLPGPPGELAAAAAAGVLRLLFRAAEAFAALPLHGPAAAPGPAGWTALTLLAAGAARAARGRRRTAAVPAGAALAVWMAWPALAGVALRGGPLLCTLDVGQGDAAVVRTERGRWIVLDAGPGPGPAPTDGPRAEAGGFDPGRWGADAGRRVLVPFLRSRGARAVELFVLSHPHLDHLGGAAALFEAFPVRRVLEAGHPLAAGAYLDFLAAVEEAGTAWLRGRAGARATVDGVELLVLAPPPRQAAAPGQDPNEVSVVVRVRVASGLAYLNSGDAPAAAEAWMLRRWPADSLRAELLKLGHHGSRTSSSVAFLRAVRPELAVVSAGRGNRHGHPHAETLARLDSAGVERVWRTDRDGPLCLEPDGDGGWRVVSPSRR